ncbi:hypothetical protein F3Y22_tig00111769pilonHSYRG00272 [Hibiscus syriacus]|uniref:Uncharacterized protein n=1 Tax=Hibiscus syriacus TaxID=106335 RepID=A0A6A2XDZ4_HIBSY|nr:hypothetical protein F3Y22_tig00111769pilonHSYRG00272 [Hibiscus syriacus]
MERKTRGSPKKMWSSNLCMPRTKGSNKNKRLSPASLIERFREAVFRLIMLSALTKVSTHPHGSSSAGTATPWKYYRPADAHHSEAVADCIEFIKKKAYGFRALAVPLVKW